MNVSESGTQAIVMSLRSEGQTSRADYVDALWQALLSAWKDTGEYTRQYSELQEETNRLAAELAAAREEQEVQELYATHYNEYIMFGIDDEKVSSEFLKKTKDVQEHPSWWEWYCLCRTCQDDGTR